MNTKIKKDKNKANAPKDGTMSFIDHLTELRKRLIRYFVVLIVFVLATYFFRVEILDLIKKPVDLPLDKYTSSATVSKSQPDGAQLNLQSLNCVCQPSDKAAKSVSTVDQSVEKTSVEKEKTDGVTSDKKPEDKGLGGVITSTIDDFVMYFQALLGKEPRPIFNDDVIVRKPGVKDGGSPGISPDGQLNLECQCSLATPVDDGRGSMVYIGLPELFFTQMKVAIFAGLFLSFPYLLIELWGFIGPALYSGEKKVFWIFAVGSYFFFIGGALFGYFVVFPFGFDFFLSLTQYGEIMPSLSIGAYLSFAIKLLVAFGAIFELPLVVFILARMGIVTPGLMIKQARIALFAIFVAAAFLTPPDPLTMMFMAGPLILLYIFSIAVCFIGLNRQKASLRAQGIDPDEDDDDE